MARRTPFYAHLANIAAGGKSCPSGSSMIAGKCVSDTPTSATSRPTSIGLLSRIQTPTKKVESPTRINLGSAGSSQSVPVTEKTPIAPMSSRPTQTIIPGTSISNDQMSAIKEKIFAVSTPETRPDNVHIGAGRSISGILPTAQKAIAGPTITLARPSEERSTPNTSNPVRYSAPTIKPQMSGRSVNTTQDIAAIRKKISLGDGVAVQTPGQSIPGITPTTEKTPLTIAPSESTGYIFRGTPIKM